MTVPLISVIVSATVVAIMIMIIKGAPSGDYSNETKKANECFHKQILYPIWYRAMLRAMGTTPKTSFSEVNDPSHEQAALIRRVRARGLQALT